MDSIYEHMRGELHCFTNADIVSIARILGIKDFELEMYFHNMYPDRKISISQMLKDRAEVVFFFEFVKDSGYTESMAEKDLRTCSEITGCEYSLLDEMMRLAWYGGDSLGYAVATTCTWVPSHQERASWILRMP